MGLKQALYFDKIESINQTMWLLLLYAHNSILVFFLKYSLCLSWIKRSLRRQSNVPFPLNGSFQGSPFWFQAHISQGFPRTAISVLGSIRSWNSSGLCCLQTWSSLPICPWFYRVAEHQHPFHHPTYNSKNIESMTAATILGIYRHAYLRISFWNDHFGLRILRFFWGHSKVFNYDQIWWLVSLDDMLLFFYNLVKIANRNELWETVSTEM